MYTYMKSFLNGVGSHLCVFVCRRELTELREELDEEKMKRVALQVTPIINAGY